MSTISTVLFSDGKIVPEQRCFTGIYGIQNNINNKWYVGESIHVIERIKDYLGTIGSGQRLIKFAFAKYGKNNFTCYKLEECSVDKLASRELYWATMLNSLSPNGYNLKVGKNSCQLYSQESKDKMRNSQLGKTKSAESNEKRRIASMGNKNSLGKTQSEESNEKRRIALTGNTYNNGKHSIGNKYALGNTYRRGVTLSEETKKKISDSKKMSSLVKWLEEKAPWFCNVQLKETA